MSRMGVGWGDPPWKRLATPVGGLLLFLGCVIAGHVACRTEEILPFAGGTVGAVLVVGVPLALFLQSRLRWMRTLEPAALTWRHAAFAVALGIAIVLIALIS